MGLMQRACILMVGLLLVWQAIVMVFQLPPYILPTPLEVCRAAVANAGLLLSESVPTLIETLVGLLLGIILGCVTALLMAFVRPLTLWLLPILIISQALPTFAIAPLLVIWFGFGMTAKIITTMIMLFFPVTSAFFDALRRTETTWLDLTKSLHAKKWRVFCYVRLPAALPGLASGIRVATVIAPMGAIIGEWVGSSRGLGSLILNANARMQIDLMFAALAMVVGLSLLLYFLVDWGTRWLSRTAGY